MSFYEKYGKRMFESAFALVLILVMFPAFVIGFVVSLIETKGRPFFSQRRVSGGNLIWIVKLRTIIPRNGERDPEKVEEMEFIRVGYLLRRFGIDDYPVLWEVLFGKIRFFGPKAALYEEVQELLENRRYRLAKKGYISPAALAWRLKDVKEIQKRELEYLDGPITFKKDFEVIKEACRVLFGKKFSRKQARKSLVPRKREKVQEMKMSLARR